ncbi:MAG TPA: tetratricopeptide repeat protein [Kiloniellales bacterium]|nr:tetratricopeptide repeat protein [Kiloniellales bacterium]
MRRILELSFLMLVLLAPAARADSPDERLCVTWAAADEAQLAACTRALAQTNLDDAARVVLLEARAWLYKRAERYAEAIADYDAAIALAPEDASLYRDRAEVQSYLGNYQAALADLDRSLEIEPNYVWAWYARGFMLERLGRNDEALASYDEALSLDPEDWDALDSRSKLQLRLGNNAAAIVDLDTLLVIDPYSAEHYVRRGIAWERSGGGAEALRDYRIGQLLNANYYEADEGLDRLGGNVETRAIDARPLDFSPPLPGLGVTFLEVQIDPKAEKDEMEEAIDDLVGWFGGSDKPLPLESHYLTRSVVSVDGRMVGVEAALVYPEIDKDQPSGTQSIVYIDGLWPSLLPNKGNLRAEIRYDLGALERVWSQPLGQVTGGTAKLIAICPSEEVRDPMVALLGCTPGKQVPLGKVEWDVTPEAWEEVLVPAGRFATLRLRHHEVATITIAGKSVTRQTVALWWWSPDVGWFVRRRLNEEDKARIIEAVEIDRPG